MADNPFKYMVLYYNTPDGHFGYNENLHFEKINEYCDTMGISVSPIDIVLKKSKQTKYCFMFKDQLPNRENAQKIAESFSFSMSLITGPNNVRVGGPLIINIPLDMLKEGRQIDHIEFMTMEEDVEAADEIVIEVPEFSRGFSQSTTIEDHELAWKLSPYIFGDHSFFLALAYLESSQEYFFVYPGQIPDIFYNPDEVPFTALEKIKFEHALEDAYKSVEALIGEPPSNHKRLCDKLFSIGVDPYLVFKKDPEEKLFESVKKLKTARGQKAAHVKTISNRRIYVEELMIYQITARTVIIEAIESKYGLKF